MGRGGVEWGRGGKGGWWDWRQALIHLTVIVLFFSLSSTFCFCYLGLFILFVFYFLVLVWPQTNILYLHETAS